MEVQESSTTHHEQPESAANEDVEGGIHPADVRKHLVCDFVSISQVLQQEPHVLNGGRDLTHRDGEHRCDVAISQVLCGQHIPAVRLLVAGSWQHDA